MRRSIARACLAVALALAGTMTVAAAPPEKSNYDIPPKAKKIERPKYPQAAFDQRIEGTVLLQITIDADGRVKDPLVLESIPALDDAAVECVKRWRFKPARKDGRPVSTVANAPVSFRIIEKTDNEKADNEKKTDKQ